jgi:hypothetical protein
MSRFFNTAGPCRPDDHYMLPPERRIADIRTLVDQKAYFVLHAPRQCGKTTALLTLAQQLTAEGRYAALLVTVETGEPHGENPGAAEGVSLDDWRSSARAFLPADLQPPPWPDAEDGRRIGAALEAWCRACPRPLVLFVDEADALRDQALVTLLRQLRAGFPRRPEAFPWSLALIGLRDVRDYKVATGGTSRLGTSSPFNIKTDSLTLENFTHDDVAELYGQHTTDTGQVFTPDAVARAFHLTQGQPWLVNALARQLTEKLVTNRTQSITAADVDRAKDILIQRQDTHLDSLAERLREPRVRAVMEPILAGGVLPPLPQDDLRFVLDLGLLRQTTGGVEVANPIYAEIIPTILAYVTRASLPSIQPTWLTPDGRLDADKLLSAFLAFWRQHGEPLMGTAHYHEIAPHLVLMAFLHRVVNGGGSIDREYAIGRGRMDLLVQMGPDRLAMELKVWRDGEPDPVDDGLAQLDGYLEGLGLPTGWLVVFDRRPNLPRMAQRTASATATTPAGRSVVVVRA